MPEAPVIQLKKYFNPDGKLTLAFKDTDVEAMMDWVEQSGCTFEIACMHAVENDNDPVFGKSLVFPSSTQKYEFFDQPLIA